MNIEGKLLTITKPSEIVYGQKRLDWRIYDFRVASWYISCLRKSTKCDSSIKEHINLFLGDGLDMSVLKPTDSTSRNVSYECTKALLLRRSSASLCSSVHSYIKIDDPHVRVVNAK